MGAWRCEGKEIKGKKKIEDLLKPFLIYILAMPHHQGEGEKRIEINKRSSEIVYLFVFLIFLIFFITLKFHGIKKKGKFSKIKKQGRREGKKRKKEKKKKGGKEKKWKVGEGEGQWRGRGTVERERESRRGRVGEGE